jgi:hypothetical protein
VEWLPSIVISPAISGWSGFLPLSFPPRFPGGVASIQRRFPRDFRVEWLPSIVFSPAISGWSGFFTLSFPSRLLLVSIYDRGKRRSPSDIARDQRRIEAFLKIRHQKQNGRDLLQIQEQEIQSAESPEPASQPAPKPATDHEAHNRALRNKLRQAVAVANGCARRLESEQDEAREKVRKLEWALLIERAAHQKRKDNPMCTPLLPTPAEVQARMAAEEKKKAQDSRQEEHRRQAQVERNLRMQLAQRIECEREKERREKEVQERKADSARSSARLERVWPWAAVCAAANALAISRGRKRATFADFRECQRVGPPRPVGKPRTIPETSTSLEHCTQSSSDQECQ